MPKIKLKIDSEIMSRIRKVTDVGGYSSPEEFVMHIIERELDILDPSAEESEEEIRKKMQGLGYIE